MTQYENNFYRTSDGLFDIEFLFVNLDELGWRAYILTDLDYQMFDTSRSTSITIIHRLTESDPDLQRKIRNFMQATRNNVDLNKSIHYICWTSTINNIEDMRELARTWSEITAYYIKHGGTFDTIQPMLKRKGIISI